MTDEPLPTTSVAGPAILAGLVMLFVHAAASALLTVVAATASPGPEPPGGVWPGVVWVVGVVAAAVALRPILRRAARPLPAAFVAGVLAAVGYGMVSVGLAAPAAATPWLGARLLSLPAAATVMGLLVGREPRRPA
jgi:hypothetical protein